MTEIERARDWLNGYNAAKARDSFARKRGKVYGPWEKDNYCRNPRNLEWAERILGVNKPPEYIPTFTTLENS